MRFTSIFGNADRRSDGKSDPVVERFECTADNASLCLVRATFGSAARREGEPVRLAVSANGTVHHFPVIEGSGENGAAEFLMPSALLSADRFELENANGTIALPRLVQRPGEGPDLDAVFLAQQERLADAVAEVPERERLLGDELELVRAQLEEAQRARAEAAERADAAEGAVSQHGGQVEGLAGELESARAELETARAEAESARAEAESARGELESARAELEQVRTELGTEREAHAGLQESSQAELASLRSELESARGEAESARAELESARAELETARAELESARAEAESARAELEQVRTELGTEREAHAALQESSQAELASLRAAIEEERAKVAEAAKGGPEVSRLEESRKRAALRISQLERANQEIEGRRAVAESAIADLRRIAGEERAQLEAERAGKAEALARLEAVEETLKSARAARYRAEQELLELRAALAVYARASHETGGVSVVLEPDAPTRAMAAIKGTADAPYVSAESLSALDFDSLAEGYDTAAGAWRNHARTGDEETAERWRVIALQLVDEAVGREEAREQPPDGGRRIRTRNQRLRDQLREACAERLRSGEGA